MYKGKLKDGDLDKFSEEEIALMQEESAARRDKMSNLYDIEDRLNL
jgi:hypothetical protein